MDPRREDDLVTDLMVMPGLINLDFADIRAVMSEMGKAMMGTGEGEGDNRAIEAAEAAISNPLLDEVSMKGARGVLINITGGMDMTLFEVDEAANRIRDEVDPEANIIFGSTFIQDMDNKMRVSVVATGIDVDESLMPRPVTLSLVADASGKPIAGGQAPAASGAGRATATAVGATSADAAGALALDRQQLAEQIERAFAEPEQAALPIQEEAYEEAPEAAEAPETPETPETPEAPEAEKPMADDGYYEEAAREEFIPPLPAEPDSRATMAAGPDDRPDPFAEADLANGARQHQAAAPKAAVRSGRSRAQSLLAKVTGAARIIHGSATSAAEPAPRPASRPLPARPAAARTSASAAERARATGGPSLRPSSQPDLSGLEAPEASPATSAEEELLDIPAFLRRQAN